MSFPGQNHHPHTPGTPPNSALLLPVYSAIPPGLELVQAHCKSPRRSLLLPFFVRWLTLDSRTGFVRHGERTPVRKRLTSAGVPSVFPLCSIGKQFGTAVLQLAPTSDVEQGEGEDEGGATPSELKSFEGDVDLAPVSFQVNGNGRGHSHDGPAVQGRLEVRRLTEEQGTGNKSVPGGMADCYWGELTDIGRHSTLALGGQLRKLYVDQGFLPSSLPNLPLEESPVAFRSTGMPRTIESLHQVVAGLFPDGKRDGPVDYVVRTPDAESLYPNSQCLRMRTIDKQYAARAAELYNPTLAPLDTTIGKYIDGPVKIDGNPRANGILDTTMVAIAHNIPMPHEFKDPKTLRILEAAVVHEWFDAYQSLEFKKLSMGRLLGDLRASFESKIADPAEKHDKLRLGINACHDTSLSGILNALDAFDSRWPPFTSYISFELLRTTPSSPTSTSTPSPSFLSSFLPSFLRAPTTPPQHYIRPLYNSKPVHIPLCAEEGNHLPGSEGRICTWEAFREAVAQVEISAKEWEKGCSKN